MNKTSNKRGIPTFGYIPSATNPITYQIGKGGPLASTMDDIESGAASAEKTGSDILSPISVDSFKVWPNGANNDDPSVCKALIKGNRLLPSVLEKQIAILYGRGPQLYRETTTETGEVQRHYLQDPDIQAWLESWQENGISDDYRTYLNECIRSYYYSEGAFSKYRFSALARFLYTHPDVAIDTKVLPVVGLEHISEVRCRFCTRKDISLKRDITLRDFEYVMVRNWDTDRSSQEYRVFPLLNRMDPLKHPSPVSYSRNPNYGDDVYASNVFFAGIKDWITGCNATPTYINSFLENALSARHHVIIPNAWMAAKEGWIKRLCEENAERQAAGQPLKKISMGRGSAWQIEVGVEYSEEYLEKYVQLELKKLKEFLSGRGKNQGKVYSTRAFLNDNGQEEKWEINEISQKYKEYIEALISYDKRADMVLLAAKGIDPSISNITPDGTVSKSGADAYYNYMIYLTQQSIAEQVVCADINYAIRLNFPEKYAEGIRLGFFRPNVQRQEDLTPSQRMSNKTEQ